MNLFNRLKNVGTIISLVSVLVLIVTTIGLVDIDSEKVINVTYLACSVGVMLGVLNNPETTGVDLPGIDYPVHNKPTFPPYDKQSDKE